MALGLAAHALHRADGPHVLAVRLAHAVGDLADVLGVARQAPAVHLLPDEVAHADDRVAARLGDLHGLRLARARHAGEAEDPHDAATVGGYKAGWVALPAGPDAGDAGSGVKVTLTVMLPVTSAGAQPGSVGDA